MKKVNGKGDIKWALKHVKRYSITLLKRCMKILSPKILFFTYQISKDLKKKKKFWQHSMFAMVGGERHPPAMLAGVQTDSTLVEAIW